MLFPIDGWMNLIDGLCPPTSQLTHSEFEQQGCPLRQVSGIMYPATPLKEIKPEARDIGLWAVFALHTADPDWIPAPHVSLDTLPGVIPECRATWVWPKKTKQNKKGNKLLHIKISASGASEIAWR